ncbi:unnamed protein product [Oikopleura dioica]|uniref:RING-type domain-containing protein n=1 Tax=Oikopleura dioica TaxID=34765 RepID=E4YPE4_OIKDI|nr:unnamed protein product [Oikopleura dioica]
MKNAEFSKLQDKKMTEIYQAELNKVYYDKSLETKKCDELRAVNEHLLLVKIHKEAQIKNLKLEVEKLKSECARKEEKDDDGVDKNDIKRKLEISVERVAILSLENDVLKSESSNKEEVLRAEILNLNKGISRKTEKCADLLAENDRLKKKSQMLTEEIAKKESESKKRNANLNIEVVELKRDADLQKAQSESSINKLQNDNQELHKQLKGVANIKTQAQEHIRQLIDLFDVENNSHSEMRVKELEDQNAALKTVNTDLELISKKFEQMTSCSLCDERYESTGEQAPVKLKCSHVFCSNCANNWLKSQGNKSSCPSCREPYRCEDIRFVNLNTDL